MKVFISWSGTLSHKVAISLRDWFPLALQSVTPYVSSEDIYKGSRWGTDIAGELDSSNFGIICVTKDNLQSPWINFEAGALSKSVENSHVCPLLIGIERSELTTGPLLQFQSTLCAKDDFYKLFSSINNCIHPSPIASDKLRSVFDTWWPQLDSSICGTIADHDNPAPAAGFSGGSLDINRKLEEITNLLQQQNRVINSPEILLPTDYIEEIIRILARSDLKEYKELNDIDSRWRFVKSAKEQALKSDSLNEESHKLLQAIDVIAKPIEYLISVKFGLRSKSDIFS